MAGLRLAAHRLGAAAVHLYTANSDGHLVLAEASHPDAAPSLAAVAETLGTDLVVMDVSRILDGAQFAVGQRSGALVFVAIGVDLDTLDREWDDAFAESVAVIEAILRASGDSFPSTVGHANLLHEVATHPGAFDERLRIAIAGLAEALGTESAAFCTVTDGVWKAEEVCDPGGHLPRETTDVAETLCGITVRADGPVALNDSSAYLGAPVFSDGRTIGTLIATSRAPRTEPFTGSDRALIESLSRWVGAAIGGRAAAQRLADREAALSAFVDRAPVSMGLVVYDDALPADLRFVTVNATAAALLGASGKDLGGRLASEVGVHERTRRAWALGCRQALSSETGTPLPTVTLDFETSDGARILSVTLGRLDVHDTTGTPVACVSFVAEDVTERELNLRSTAEHRDAFEQTTTQQAALFKNLHRDLRSSLTTILGYADLLGDEMSAEDIRAVRDVMLRSGNHLLSLLDDAVAISEATRVSVSLVPVDAGRLVGGAVGTCQAAAEASSVQTEYASETSHEPVLMDPALVERIVQMLLGDAIECASETDARRVDVRLGEDDRGFMLDASVPGATLRIGPSDALRPVLAERLAERMGGTFTVIDHGQWQVRLPRNPAVVVELPARRKTAPAHGETSNSAEHRTHVSGPA